MTSEQLIEQGKLLRERNAELQARIADQEQVMQALLRGESRYRTLIHLSPDPVFVSRIDDFTFTEVNDRACTDYGYSREEFLTMQIFDIETQAPLRQQVRDFYDATAVGQVVEVDGVNRRKDGSTFPVHVRFTKLDDEFALAVVRDVTERRYRSLYTKTPAMLHSIDPSGRLLEASERWLEVLGYERSEVLGRKTVEFLTEESRRYAETVTLPQFFKTGYARDIAYQFVKKSGEVIDILLSAILERDAEGRISRTLAVLTNVTEQRQAEKALRTSHEQLQVLSRRLIDIQEMERGRIARELHDEIGQALTAVKLNLQRIQRMSAKSSVSRSVSEGIVIVDNAVDDVRNLALDLKRRVISHHPASNGRPFDGPRQLTPRQREILQLIVESNSTKEIARKLELSVKTVETHRVKLMGRLDIHDVAGLVRYAIGRGLVTPDA